MSKIILIIVSTLVVALGGRDTVHRDLQVRPTPVAATATPTPPPAPLVADNAANTVTGDGILPVVCTPVPTAKGMRCPDDFHPVFPTANIPLATGYP